MSNWGTMKTELLRNVRVDTTSAGSVADTDASRAIIESILFNRRHFLGFNQASFTIQMENGVQRYKLPSDYLALTSPVWWSNIPDTSNPAVTAGRRELVSRPLAWVESNTFRIPGQSEYRYLGDSIAYAITQQSSEIVLSPVPGATQSQLDFNYLRDPGTPGMSASSGTWTFTVPRSEDAITDAFTNDWFELGKGYHLILSRACFLLWARIYGGTEESERMQAQQLRLWGEEIARLRGEATKFASNSDIRPRI